ncbi:MAG: hypothetical protein HUJ75_04100 [Parasporobacterium sp.]|nr:hypothetical protein [Parasporobacterium sp.]
MKHPILKKLKSRKGVTLVEMLLATLILLLASSAMISAVSFSTTQFNKSFSYSQSLTLSSTIRQILNKELRYADQVSVKQVNGKYVLDQYFSDSYGQVSLVTIAKNGEDIDEAEYGLLAVKAGTTYMELINESTYTNGITVKLLVNDVKLDATNTKVASFTVEMTIKMADGTKIADTFSIMPIGNSRVEIKS